MRAVLWARILDKRDYRTKADNAMANTASARHGVLSQ